MVACAKHMWSRSSRHIRMFMLSSTPERKEIMAAASGSQRKLDGHVLNQAKRSRMSYTRVQAGSCESVPRDKSVPNCQTILSQHEHSWMLGSWCWVSNTRHRADLQLGSLNLITPPDCVFFSTIASLIPRPCPHGDWRSVVLMLVTITMQVGVVNMSISTYPLLSTYFLPLTLISACA